MDMDNLIWLYGKFKVSGVLKVNLEDFVVVEDLGFELDGEGEYLLVCICKYGCNI